MKKKGRVLHRNSEARSRNHFYRENSMKITYSEFVSVALP